MNIELPNGEYVGLGLQLPASLATSMPVYEDSGGPMFTEDRIRELAGLGVVSGRKRFDRSFIKNQKTHSSCNGFAGAEALTRARVLRGLPRVDLSGAYLYSLINGGRDSGSLLEDGMAAILTRGIATEATVGWDAIYPSKYDRAKADAEAEQYRGFECYATRDKIALLSGLAAGFVGVVAVHVGRSFTSLDSQGRAGADYGPGNHAVCVDGLSFDGGEVLLDMPNSWGTDFGQEGRAYLTWDGHLRQTTQYHQFYLIRSTSDGGHSGPPSLN